MDKSKYLSFNERGLMKLMNEMRLKCATNIDLTIYNRETCCNIFFEFRECKEKSIKSGFSPSEAEPNKYFYYRQRGSTLYLWNTIKDLNKLAEYEKRNPLNKLYFIYFSEIEGYTDVIKICEITNINEKNNSPIEYKSQVMNRNQFKEWITELDKKGCSKKYREG